MNDSPKVAAFDVCGGFGCTVKHSLVLDEAQWRNVSELFFPRAIDAAEERCRIARAVALLEYLVGEKNGTAQDAPRNDLAGAGQLDCIAESVNTSVYLLMLQGSGLLNYHVVGAPERRGTFIFYPHNTAILVERDSGQAFAVDSWFRENGALPAVVPVQLWKDGWRPVPQAEQPEAHDNTAGEGHGV
ncbi:MAG: hypothetical protein V3573_11740 [Desulfovibrionaceae bacterium]